MVFLQMWFMSIKKPQAGTGVERTNNWNNRCNIFVGGAEEIQTIPPASSFE
jgi:hypothetical protein